MRRLDVLFVALFACMLVLVPQRAMAQDEEVEGYVMNDLRATVHLPDKWEVPTGG